MSDTTQDSFEHNDSKQWRMVTKEQRYQLIEKLFILHPRIKSLWAELDQFIQLSHKWEEQTYLPNLAIVGASGVGKSHLIQTWLHDRKIQKLTGESKALYFNCVGWMSSKGMLITLLNALGDPSYSRGTTYDMFNRLTILVRNTSIRLLIIDSLEHLVHQGQNRTAYNAQIMLEELLHTMNIQTILLGREEMQTTLHASPRLERSIIYTPILTSFEWDEDHPQTIQEFRQILYTIDQRLPLDYSHFSDDPFAVAFFHATQGSMGSLMKLIRFAAQNAVEAEEVTISRQRLAEAYSACIVSSSLDHNQENPFC